MISILRKFLRPTLRQQLEEGVRDALRRYADRRTAPDLRVYVSVDLVPEGVSPEIWARDEADHLRRFAAQWAEDNGIARAGLRVETVLLDTKREFAFVKPLGLERQREHAAAPAAPPAAPRYAATPGREGVLEIVRSEALREPLRVAGETTVGRKPEGDVLALGDRYMSARHARFAVRDGRFSVTDLDSKNRTFVNDAPLPPHQERVLERGDTIRMGNTILRFLQVE
jgi:hypothetical protein